MSNSLRLSAAAVLLLAALADSQATASQGPPAAGPAKKRTLPEVQMVPSVLDFGPLGPGQASVLQTVITNVSPGPVTVTGVSLVGFATSDFSAAVAPALPFVLGPGLGEPVSVTFQPTAKGMRTAQLRVAYSASADRVAGAVLSGVGLGVPGEELNVNSGAFGTYVDALGVVWSTDFGASEGSALTNPSAIAGTVDDPLYRTYRGGQSFAYALPLPSGGYAVTLHFAEPLFDAPGGRVFDVRAEGELLLDDLDLAAVAGKNSAYASKHFLSVSGGILELELTATVGSAIVSAIEVESAPVLDLDPAALDFGAVVSGTSSALPLTLRNAGATDLHVTAVSFLLGSSGTSAAFTLGLDGQVFAGADEEVTYPLGLVLPPGAELAGSVSFAPTADELDAGVLAFESDGGDVEVALTGLGGHVGHPFLHVVLADPGLIVDYEGDGFEGVVLDGSQSHTHFPGGALVGFEWKEGDTVLSSAPVAVGIFPAGPHDLSFTITDDTVPPETLSDNLVFEVHPKTAVPGALARYYQATSGSAAELFDRVPANADFAELLGGLSVDGGAHIGSSPFTQNVLAVLDAKVTLPATATYAFTAAGGSLREITLDGLAVAGPLDLTAGTYDLQARFAVDNAAQQPLQVLVKVGAGAQGPLDPAWLAHDQSQLLPVINTMPAVGTDLGGNQIVIAGLGFFPFGEVVVNWGAETLSGAELSSVSASEIRFVSPPGSGEISVTVTTPQGTSNARPFVYDESGPVPIRFVQAGQTSVWKPTGGEWGPDGRFYVPSTNGTVTAIEYDDSYAVVSKTTYPGVSGHPCKAILGLAFNPHDPPGQVRIFVGHTELFSKGGGSFTGPAPYTSQVSILEGPGFGSPIPLITGLPTSNHDHGINGMYFDHNGDLLFLMGGNTNAGVKWPIAGDLPESPLSAALVKARTSLGPAFNGALSYVETATGIPNDDQVFGEIVDLGPGTNVFVYAAGLRNPYDVVLTPSGRVYATDNGPNSGFGPASTGPASIDPVQPQYGDELLLIRHGVYYGSPNRNRGRYFPAENVYQNPFAPDVPGVFRQTLTTYTSSTDGIAEYRARTFQGQIRGDLFVQKYAGHLRHVALSDDGMTVESVTTMDPFTSGLGVETGPGGALLVGYHDGDQVTVLVPDDVSALGLIAHDVTPWRAPASGGHRFVIGGVGFGSLADTTVAFGDLPAALESVSPTRIVGQVPANPLPSTDLVSVTVTVGAVSDTLPAAFRYLCAPGCELGTWEALPSLLYGLDEVAAGAIAGKLYAVGQGDPRTAAFDLEAGQWLADAAPRPFPGSAHGAEVVAGKLYLIGGLGGGAPGKVQIYDPATNGWSLGAAMPWAGGSVSTALIQGKIYAAGGIAGSATVRNTAVYDPVANTWTARALMPVGRNHAAAATDGQRLFVFGGRDGDAAVTNGFDDVQIYDPKTNSWKWDKDGASGLAPLPQSRGGMGKAVFFQGEFFVFGGETQSDPGALPSKVYDRVDVYDPVENTWRLDSAMLDPRHGIFPLHYEGRIYLPGGGSVAGVAPSALFDVFTRL